MVLDLEAAHAAKHASVVNATTKHGHEKARAETVIFPVRLDFGVIFEHVQGVIHDLSHQKVLLDVGRILGQRDLQQTILENYGDIFYKQIRNTIRDVAFGDPPATNGRRARAQPSAHRRERYRRPRVERHHLPAAAARPGEHDRAHRRQVDDPRNRPVAAQSDRDGGDGAVD